MVGIPEAEMSGVARSASLSTGIGKRRCTKCGEWKNLDELSNDTRRKDGKSSWCRKCSYIGKKDWRKRNHDKDLSCARAGYRRNRDREIRRSKNWQAKNETKYRQGRKDRCREIGEYIKRWRANNPEKASTIDKRRNDKRRSTAKGRLNDAIRHGIWGSIIRGSKSFRTWTELVSFTLMQLKRHLEKQFKPGMRWDNYGSVWEIDHKIPISAFNFETPEDSDFKRCWALKNLQPLPCSENRSKNDKLGVPFQPSLLV